MFSGRRGFRARTARQPCLRAGARHDPSPNPQAKRPRRDQDTGAHGPQGRQRQGGALAFGKSSLVAQKAPRGAGRSRRGPGNGCPGRFWRRASCSPDSGFAARAGKLHAVRATRNELSGFGILLSCRSPSRNADCAPHHRSAGFLGRCTWSRSGRGHRYGTGMSKARAQQCLAQAVWYEAASETKAGQRAVAQVVLNRVAHSNWPSSVCGVVYQGSNRSTGCQFSFTCDGSLRRKASGASWARAQRVAAAALAGDVYAPIGHATHYHTLWVNPYWAGSLEPVGTIGAHRFYRNRGAAGRKGAFSGVYAGAEPSVGGRTNAAPTPIARARIGVEPVQANGPARATSQSRSVASTPARINARTQESGSAGSRVANPTLSEAGQVKDNYASAGQWKIDPSTLDLSREPQPIDQP